MLGGIFCIMPTGHKATFEDFLRLAKKAHGDRYDYSMVKFEAMNKKVDIICPKHGVFRQTPAHHCHRGDGCPECRREGFRKIICGIAINDAAGIVYDTDAYKAWLNMIKRCYDAKTLARRPNYTGCQVCDEWLRFSNFQLWYNENCKPGYQIDKDILIKGNKLYSPETCLGVPSRINALFISARSVRGKYPIGVCRHYKKYEAQINYGSGSVSLGDYSSPEEAFLVYKRAKERYIKQLAQEYYSSGLITKRVYDALMKYQVEITD